MLIGIGQCAKELCHRIEYLNAPVVLLKDAIESSILNSRC